MTTFPLPASLVMQVAASLRQALHSGMWGQFLPSENELCQQLHVSRRSLRLALAQLEREGWIQSGQGRRRKVLRRRSATNRHSTSKDILLLTPRPLSTITPFAMFWMDELRRSLAEAGYRLEICANENCYGSRPNRALQVLAERRRPAGWVLYLSTPAMQRWFSQQHLPNVIAGSRHAGAVAVSVDLNYRAVCHHAAARLVGAGHRRLALITPRSELAGDLESELGFKEGARRDSSIDAQVYIVRHDGTVPGLRAKLDALIHQAEAPTAFLISSPNDVLTALGHLALRGISLPKNASVVSRGDEPFLKHVVPSIARYSISPTLFARKISRCVLELAQSGMSRPRDYRLIPRFIAGQTLAAAPDKLVSSRDK